jgi:hypothetical protein
LLNGYVPPPDQRAVERWIVLNEGVLVDYWNSTISTAEMLKLVRPLLPPVLP